MQTTGDLFETPEFVRPIARRRDPSTSKQAAEIYTRTNRGPDLALMHELILEKPGLTSNEYGDILQQRGMDPLKAHRMPNRRISELVQRGDVIIGKTRKCSKTARTVRTYYAKPDQ